MLVVSMAVSAQGKFVQTDEYKNEVRNTLALDYSMPDYSSSKINAKVMGKRLSEILNKFHEIGLSQTNMGTLSVILAKQIDGMIYCAIKKVNLNRMVKQGNVITITYDTVLAENAMKMKKTQIVFTFVDGVSEDVATNDFFSNVCRYIKN